MTFRGSRAGKYRQIVQLQALVETGRDDVGGVSQAWQDLIKDLFCNINPGKGREFEAAQNRDAETTHVISARFTPGYDFSAYEALRVVVGHTSQIGPPPGYPAGRKLRVLATPIDRDETGHEWLISCTENT